MKIFVQDESVIIENKGIYPKGKLFVSEKGDQFRFTSVTGNDGSFFEFAIKWQLIQDEGGSTFGTIVLVRAYLTGVLAPVVEGSDPLKEDKVNKGAANGYAPLDGNAKVPIANMQVEFMEFEGNWNASTNTPTLANTDTDKQGTVYRVSVAGTHDFGAGNVTFGVGEWCVNDGTIWDQSPEASIQFGETAGTATEGNDKRVLGAAEELSTGWIGTAPIPSINGDNTLFDATEGNLRIVNHATSPPTITIVNCPAVTAQTVDNLLVAPFTFLKYGIAGTPIQSVTPQTKEQKRTTARIGGLQHVNLTNLNAVDLRPQRTSGVGSSFADFMEVFGFLSTSGNAITGASGALSINKSEGLGFDHDAGGANDNPNEVVLPEQLLAVLNQAKQDGVTFAQDAVFDPTQYDNGGTLTDLPQNNDAAIHRVYLFADNTIVWMQAQQFYSDFNAAKSAAGTETFVEPALLTFGLFLGRFVCRKDATNASDESEILFIPNIAQGDSVSTIVTLQGAYDNSIPTPEILTDATNGALTIRRGSALDTDDVVEVQNGVGTKTFSVTGEGKAVQDELQFDSGGKGVTVNSNSVGMKLAAFLGTFGIGIQSGVMEFISASASSIYSWGHGVSGSLVEIMSLNNSTKTLSVDNILVKTAAFVSEFDNGSSGAAKTIDWNNGNKQKVTLTANTTLTFTDPLVANSTAGLQLTVIQGSGPYTITWPGSVKSPDGATPTISAANGAEDIHGLYFNGTGYRIATTPNFLTII